MQERAGMRKELQRTGGRFGPVRGFVIPTLRSIGLFSPRIQAHFEEIFTANFGPEMGDLVAGRRASCPPTSRPG